MGRYESGFVRIISPISFVIVVFTPSVMIQVSVDKKMGTAFQTINQRYIPVVRTILRRPLRNIRNNFDFMLYSLALPVIEMTKDGR